MLEYKERILLRDSFAPLLDEYKANISVVEEWFYATDVLSNYSLVLPFEMKFSRAQFFITAPRIWPLSIIISIIYTALAYWGQRCMRHQKPLQLRIPLIIWNIFMTVFSAVTCLRLTPEVYSTLTMHGFIYSVCSSDYFKDPVVAFWAATFACSKIFELIDTAFVVLRKKPLTFLHCYHHASFMYTYYAATSLRFRPPRWIQICLTALQISQMLIAIVISYVVFKAKYDWQISCFQTWSNLNFAIAIYVTYFVLFSKFFYDSYLKPKHIKYREKIE